VNIGLKWRWTLCCWIFREPRAARSAATYSSLAIWRLEKTRQLILPASSTIWCAITTSWTTTQGNTGRKGRLTTTTKPTKWHLNFSVHWHTRHLWINTIKLIKPGSWGQDKTADCYNKIFKFVVDCLSLASVRTHHIHFTDIDSPLKDKICTASRHVCFTPSSHRPKRISRNWAYEYVRAFPIFHCVVPNRRPKCVWRVHP